ncbi:ER-bound oxygenase [Holotrichia oblita]|uniref:ER-bound oxygenase n=1 Tax=Holotrichia oblita TaxID=644536 RepID=A0ACB9TIF2_HOLOL|nr:ER-bound oxygenase [Holotrichia oblita]
MRPRFTYFFKSLKFRIWKSIDKVKLKHDCASQQSYRSTQVFISQKNMALTQFGFMGFIVWKTEFVGVYGAEREELEAFIHVWRVIGNIMGIEDRFNICRESVEETREICEELVERVFKPNMMMKHQDFYDMSNALLSGMWCMMPLFVHKPFIHIIATAIVSSSSENVKNINNNDNVTVRGKIDQVPDFNLRKWEKIYAEIVLGFMRLFRFRALRIFHQYVIYIALWLMNNFPFLAYYSFGRANSHIKI